MSQSSDTRSVIDLIAVLAGPVIWFAFFALIYATQSFYCARFDDMNDARLTTLFVTVSILAAIGIAAVMARGIRQGGSWFRTSDEKHFLADLNVTLGALSILAVAVVLAATLLLPSCNRILG
jgi:hypothetical protein